MSLPRMVLPAVSPVTCRGWSESTRSNKPIPLNGPLCRTVLFSMTLSVDDSTAMPSPYWVSPDCPTLSWAVTPETVLEDPPSMTTPPSKSLTVPFLTVTPVRSDRGLRRRRRAGRYRTPSAR